MFKFTRTGGDKDLLTTLCAIGVLIFVVFSYVPEVRAYNSLAHRWIVGDALDYMYSSPYATITQQAAVQDLINRYGSLAQVKKILSYEADKTDQYRDMYLRNTSFWCKAGSSLLSFFSLGFADYYWSGGYKYDGFVKSPKTVTHTS